MSIIPSQLPKDGNGVFYVKTQPTIEPITLQELKTFGRIDTDHEDELLEGFIRAVRDAAERYLRRALLEQSLILAMDFWPGRAIELPRPPLLSITEVRTLDEEGAATVYSADNYYAIADEYPGLTGKLVLKSGVTEPLNTSNRAVKGYEIEYVAGYGTQAVDVPDMLREGIKLWATALYENRVVSMDKPTPESRAMLDPYRVPII